MLTQYRMTHEMEFCFSLFAAMYIKISFLYKFLTNLSIVINGKT